MVMKASEYAKTEAARNAEAKALGKPAISTALASRGTATPDNYQSLDWRDQLGAFQSNRDLGQQELRRATDKANLYKATGDTDAYNRANTWIGQINTAMGGTDDPNKSRATQYGNLYEGLITKRPEQVTAPKPFEYSMSNIQSDPIYQNAIQQALQGAQQATGNAMVGLGSRGIGNSSIAVDRANQIQQRAVGDVNSNLLPSLIEQAYTRYLNQNESDFKINQENYNRNNDYMGNISNLADVYNERYNQGVKAADDRRTGNIKNAMDLSEQYGFGVLPKDSGEELFKQVEGMPTMKQTEAQTKQIGDLVTASDKLGVILPELARLIGVEPYTSTLSAQKELNEFTYQMGMLGVSQRNASTSEANSANSNANARARLEFDKEQAKNKQSGGEKVDKNQLEAQYVIGFDSTPVDRRREAFEENKEIIISELGMSGYDALYKRYFDEYGDPR